MPVASETDVINSDYAARMAGGGEVTGPPVETVLVPLPIATVTKSGPSVVVGGEELTYSLAVTVTQGPAFDVVVTDVLPAGVEFRSATADGEHEDGTLTWQLGDLAVGTELSLEVTVRARPTAVDGVLVNADYSVRHKRGSGERGPAVVTRVRPAARLYVPLAER
jgi:uncharacterized repeat protein (TIGR01451 family)